MYHFLGKDINIPVIQGGMGIGVSLGNLAGSVAKEGGVGTISMVAPGYKEPYFEDDKHKANEIGFQKELQKAREISEGNGLIGVNIMYALTDYEDLVDLAVRSDVDFIVVGAGLPLNLPELVPADMPIAPIVSSTRALKILLRRWGRLDRMPDFLVVEGSDAGGHLGFKEIDEDFDLEELTVEILDYLEKEDLDFPVIVAGGLDLDTDLKKYRDLGAFGIQLGTRFLATEEADCHENLKRAIVDATTDDMIVFDSPVGLKGRGIYNKFLQEVEKERIPSKRCINCIKTCDPNTTRFCIYDGLRASVTGDIDGGLVFAGKSLEGINEIVTVKEVLDRIQEGLE